MRFNSKAYDKVYPRKTEVKSIDDFSTEDNMIVENVEDNTEENVVTNVENVESVDDDVGGTDDGITGSDNISTE